MSKELEDLRDLKNAFIGHCKELKCGDDYVKVCENKFDKIIFSFERKEKLEKAMKLIDKKQVAWGLIIRTQSAEEYNKLSHEYPITQEEYDFFRTFVQIEMLEEK